jgi:hypothetical protein
MNSQEFRTAARTTFALAMDAYYAVSNDNDATMEQLIAADVAKTAADAQWIADQHTANTMAQAELDAATAKGCEVVATTAAEVIASINTNEAFGIAWGADGEVLTYEQTTAAIDAGRGWFDRQGRWVNKAGWEKQHAHLSTWVTAKLAAN